MTKSVREWSEAELRAFADSARLPDDELIYATGKTSNIINDLAAALLEARRELASIKRRGAHPTFDGEGKYESQWLAWDDGYCQGLGIEDERHEVRGEPEHLRADALQAKLDRVRDAIVRFNGTDEVRFARSEILAILGDARDR